LVLIIDVFHLVGNPNYNYILEYLCETFILSKIVNSNLPYSSVTTI
jgi:hypothetical protein